MVFHRRGFLRRVAALLGAGSLSLGRVRQTGADSLDEQLEIVDTHQHLWDLDKFRLPWLKPGDPLCRSFLTEDYLKATEGLSVTRAVYMEVAVAPEQKLAEAEFVIQLCRREDNPTVAAVIGGMPGEAGFRDYILRFKDSPFVKGVRQIPPPARGGRFLYEQHDFVAGIRLLGRLGMCFDLCMPPGRLQEAIRLVDACPDTRFVCDHCGNADPKAFWSDSRRRDHPRAGPPSHEAEPWRRGMAELAKRDSVVCKISGIVARAPREAWTADDLAPIINHCLEVFGPDRVMFASDWPVCTRAATLRQWVTALREVVGQRSREEQRKLFAQNADRFYGLA
ncbi:MAG TPA: amidohydrolase [Planctomycetaceae bacterium]|nr:amidohydrolase [Planctomycetaceae bacterium]HIQ20531.1 amidohydrolase [Planctomycetota bacterium]